MREVFTYLSFDGNCREAMEFYKKCFGAELYLKSYSDAPGDLTWVTEESKDRVMHAMLAKGSTTILMAADAMPGTPSQQSSNFSVMIQCESLAEIERLFAALGENGKVTMALQDTFWGARFGTLTDQFGIPWMFNFGLDDGD